MVVLMLLGAAGVLPGARVSTSRPATVNTGGSRIPAHALEDAPEADEDSPLPPNAEPRVNLTGDEVSPALATYGIDRDGNLFEVHSPQTEEPRLAGPIG